MAITAHLIDDSWRLRTVLMRFVYVPAPHNAEVIAEELAEALIKWNLDEKLSTVTLDNCTTNDKMMKLVWLQASRPAFKILKKGYRFSA
ncbi:hypothetical protein E2562_002884 [Oryza meyeriana var. granulata]|uniref:DUF659 domain-containing protein n=1 Tax=Oryza meyeriana var. granulata TaxID=110450 RepID=A0A6G1DDE9_9ORYZ|nr:hypothetical protein E2562_002884 [Oryza meyeriana var. granulata]